MVQMSLNKLQKNHLRGTKTKNDTNVTNAKVRIKTILSREARRNNP